jgi:multiple sugar transport system permease protein
MRRRESAEEIAMLAPALLLMLAFLVVPFVMSAWLSLTNERLIPRPTPARFVGLQNFERLIEDETFWQALWNVARFTLMVLPLQCGLALGLALLLNQRLPFRGLFRSLFFLPSVVSIVVACVIWATLFQYPSGPFNTVLSVLSFGLVPAQDWLGDPATAMPAIVVLSAWHSFGFQMLVYLAGLQTIREDLHEAARIDGANAWQRFWNVTMPGLRQTHVFVLIVTTIQAFKLFTQVSILTGGGPLGSTNTVVTYMVAAGFTEQRIGYASAVALVLFVIVLAISLVQRRLTRERA